MRRLIQKFTIFVLSIAIFNSFTAADAQAAVGKAEITDLLYHSQDALENAEQHLDTGLFASGCMFIGESLSDIQALIYIVPALNDQKLSSFLSDIPNIAASFVDSIRYCISVNASPVFLEGQNYPDHAKIMNELKEIHTKLYNLNSNIDNLQP